LTRQLARGRRQQSARPRDPRLDAREAATYANGCVAGFALGNRFLISNLIFEMQPLTSGPTPDGRRFDELISPAFAPVRAHSVHIY
jgi:hypothetical protein